MNGLVPRMAERLRRLPPATTFALGLIYVLVMGALDYVTPAGTSLTLLYVPGILFVAWGTGRTAGSALAFISAAAVFLAEYHLIVGTVPPLVICWNSLSRL